LRKLILKDFKLLRINTRRSADYKGLPPRRILPIGLGNPTARNANEHRGMQNPQRGDGTSRPHNSFALLTNKLF